MCLEPRLSEGNWEELTMSDNKPEERSRESETPPAVCPVCGGPLVEIRAKLQCARCHTICETCCEGGRG
ncbi:MAG: hypothetical protein D6753_02255 [Planctomycetota bacterium]|nr:MAG: hypothetical protein D6753_02255 [Planctomycetota bacterium]